MPHVIRFGIDLSKNTFAICGVDDQDHIVAKETLVRRQMLRFIVDPMIRTTSIDRMPRKYEGAKRGKKTIQQ